METACPGCAHIYKVPDNAAGKKTRCKKCNEVFQIEPFVELDLQEDPTPAEPHNPPKPDPAWLVYPLAAILTPLVVLTAQGAFGILMDDLDLFLIPPVLAGLYAVIAVYLHRSGRAVVKAKPVVIGFAVFICVIWYGGSQIATPDFPALAKPDHDKFEAYVMSQQFVEDRLKAPASADFPTTSQADIRHLGGGRYQVVSYVDSQNAFGAMIRNHYTCELHTDDGDRWTCDTLVFDPS